MVRHSACLAIHSPCMSSLGKLNIARWSTPSKHRNNKFGWGTLPRIALLGFWTAISGILQTHFIYGGVVAWQAAALPSTTQQVPIRVTTKLISVSVIVRDKHGAPVPDLTEHDFTILDGKTGRPIQVFSVTKTDVAAPQPKSLPPDTYSNELVTRGDSPSNLTIILLDSLNTPSFDRAFPRSQIKKLLLTLKPQDRVALYALGSRLRVLHEFTSDASSLLAALNANVDVELLDVDTPPSGPTNQHNFQMVPQAEEDVAVHAAQLAGNRAAATGAALRTIADHVSYLPGRKSLIWISDEFPIYLELGNLQRTPDGRKIPHSTENELVVRALDAAHISVYPIDSRGLEASGDVDIANKNVDRTLADMDRGALMQALAHRTGGRAFTDTNGIMSSIRQTIDASRVTYELGFYPADVQWDGSFHKLQVKVNRRDAQVQARDGYYALADPTLTPDMIRGIVADAARGRIEATGIRFSVHVAPPSAGTPPSSNSANTTGAEQPQIEGGLAAGTSASSASNGEAAAARPLASSQKLVLSLMLDTAEFDIRPLNGDLEDTVDVAFITVDEKNRILQRTVMQLPFKLDQLSYEHLQKAGPLPLTREVEIPAGTTEIRVVIYDEGNSLIGSLRIPVTSLTGP
jgi:VWFA-related protein